jgi:hypothetical protein
MKTKKQTSADIAAAREQREIYAALYNAKERCSYYRDPIFPQYIIKQHDNWMIEICGYNQ